VPELVADKSAIVRSSAQFSRSKSGLRLSHAPKPEVGIGQVDGKRANRAGVPGMSPEVRYGKPLNKAAAPGGRLQVLHESAHRCEARSPGERGPESRNARWTRRAGRPPQRQPASGHQNSLARALDQGPPMRATEKWDSLGDLCQESARGCPVVHRPDRHG
jgi:hypothetical protein